MQNSFFFKFFLKIFNHEGWDLDLKNSKKKYIGFTATLVITSVYLESKYPVHIYGKSLFKQIIKSAKTPGLENVLKYAFKKKPDVDMFNDWIVEKTSKY